MTANRPRALADIQLNTILAAEQGTSSEDEVPEAQDIPAEDARVAIGVSIGHEQTRLTSPQTPAIEKAAAIDQAGGFFEAPNTTKEASSGEPEEETKGDTEAGPEREHARTTTTERWPQQPAEPRRPSKAKSLLRDGFLFQRQRAASGPEPASGGQSKLPMYSLPSMSRTFSMISPFSSFQNAADQTSGRSVARQRSQSDNNNHNISQSEREEAEATVGDLPHRPALRSVRSRQSQLRRSASDSSLGTHRTLSLGDDTRWDDVHEQVNSRLKAIKDSWQDSNIKFPSLPSISNWTAEFLRERSGSLGRKQSEAFERPTDPVATRTGFSDATANKQLTQNPHLSRALQQLEGDVVILGGYRGSILRSAEPPNRQVWVPIKVGLNIRKVDLEVGLEEDADERAIEKIIPGGMLSHIGPVDISRRLFKRLRSCENARQGKLRVHDYGYDWRLHPTYLSNQLITFLKNLPCNRPDAPKHERGATVIAHSLGGLITRHAVNMRPGLFKGVVYAGVPNTCVNILGPLRNGDEVLLSSRVLTAQVNFTIRTSFALLPLDGRCFFDKRTKEEYPVDFFDPQTWSEYRLSPCVARPLPPLYAQSKTSGITGYVSSVASAMPNLPLRGRKSSLARSINPSKATNVEAATEPDTAAADAGDSSRILENRNIDASGERDPSDDSVPSSRTAVTISQRDAMAYLTRTLATIKKFKQQLTFNPQHAAANRYPPVSVIYGKSTPTVYGAKVNGREGIKHADAYDELAFASGDGVVLARAAMVPEGYTAVRGGTVSSERGHVTLLGDLEAVGKCLNAISAARRRGVGFEDNGR